MSRESYLLSVMRFPLDNLQWFRYTPHMNDAFAYEDEYEEPAAPPPSTELRSSQYPPSLPHDVALSADAEELSDVLRRHSLTALDYDYISDLPHFRKEVAEWQTKVITEGYSFKLKLRAMAEAYLPEVHQMLTSPAVAPSVKTDLFKYITKCAELEPKKESVDSASQGPVKLVVQWGSDGGQMAVQVGGN